MRGSSPFSLSTSWIVVSLSCRYDGFPNRRGFLNFFSAKLDWESMYTNFSKHVENVNVIISTYKDEAMGDLQV